MTRREIVECTKRIMARKKEEARFDAKIHGAKLANEDRENIKPLNEDQKKIANAALERMAREKQEEIARRKQRIVKNGK